MMIMASYIALLDNIFTHGRYFGTALYTHTHIYNLFMLALERGRANVQGHYHLDKTKRYSTRETGTITMIQDPLALLSYTGH